MVFLYVNQISFTHWSSVGGNEEASQSPPVECALPRPWLLPHVLSYPLSCDILATLARACIAPPVWSAFHSDPPAVTPQLHSGLYPESYPQTVRIATSTITTLSWFLPFNLLLFPHWFPAMYWHSLLHSLCPLLVCMLFSSGIHSRLPYFCMRLSQNKHPINFLLNQNDENQMQFEICLFCFLLLDRKHSIKFNGEPQFT